MIYADVCSYALSDDYVKSVDTEHDEEEEEPGSHQSDAESDILNKNGAPAEVCRCKMPPKYCINMGVS